MVRQPAGSGAVNSRACPKSGERWRVPKHLDWIRTLPCSVAGCNGASVPAHVRQHTGGGSGLKPPDRFTVPLCHVHHMEQHRIGHVRFDARYQVDLRALSIELAVRSPALA
jgi:hypothetical protein